MELIGRGLRLRAKKNPRMRYVRRARQPSRRPAAGPLAALGTAQQDGERGAAAARTFPGVPVRSAYTHTPCRMCRCVVLHGAFVTGQDEFLEQRSRTSPRDRYGIQTREGAEPDSAMADGRYRDRARRIASIVCSSPLLLSWFSVAAIAEDGRERGGGSRIRTIRVCRALFHAHRHDTSCTRNAFLHSRHC